jgi:hypothetical protein
MACSSSALPQHEGTTDGCTPLLPEDTLATEAQWEKVLDDPILRRLLRESHHTSTRTELLTQLEEDV